jgi:hypothetical protein
MLLRFQQRFLSRRPHLVFCAFRHRIQSTLFVTGAATLSVTIFCHAGRNGVVHSLCHGCRHVVVCVCCDAVCVSLCHAAGGPATALTSAATLSSTVAVTGAATLSLTLAVAQAATVTATLSVVQTKNFYKCRHVAVDAFGNGCCYAFNNACCHASRTSSAAPSVTGERRGCSKKRGLACVLLGTISSSGAARANCC